MLSLLVCLLIAVGALASTGEAPDCARLDCRAAFPEAARFEVVEGRPYVEALDAAERRLGWVVLSTSVTDVKGYSGKPLATLVGLDTSGRIAGARVVEHAEPILLVGIPESALERFVSSYAGFHATDEVSVGRRAGKGPAVDVISGATVTVLAENQTILGAARALAEDVGVIPPQRAAKGHFVTDQPPWSWDRLVRKGVLGRLVVSDADMGRPESGEPYLDLYFTIADAPHVGVPLLGEHLWRRAVAGLAEGEHLVVILNRGSGSYKGSGFVRGGLFDRVRLQQGLRSVTFTDLDYTNLGRIPAEGAPTFREAGLFVARGALDPGVPFELVFLGSRFTGKGGIEREFHTFGAVHRLPRTVWRHEGLPPELQVAADAWRARPISTALLVVYLAALAGLFVARRWTSGSMRRLQRLHTTFLVGSFVVLGLWLHLQPSITQLLTLVGSVRGEWRWSLFLSDPHVFVTWIFIALVIVLWGRGVFCGWACPYGAMSELLFRLGQALGIRERELSDRAHGLLKYARYLVLAALVGVFLWDPVRGEMLAEVEPFKSTFFVPFWTRSSALAAWWLALAAWAVFTYRPFCRYICPLGAALALPSSFRVAGPLRRDFCSRCRICTRGCEPRAIRPDGTIDPRECLNCWECEANYRDDQVCPPLVRARRDQERAPLSRAS